MKDFKIGELVDGIGINMPQKAQVGLNNEVYDLFGNQLGYTIGDSLYGDNFKSLAFLNSSKPANPPLQDLLVKTKQYNSNPLFDLNKSQIFKNSFQEQQLEKWSKGLPNGEGDFSWLKD